MTWMLLIDFLWHVHGVFALQRLRQHGGLGVARLEAAALFPCRPFCENYDSEVIQF